MTVGELIEELQRHDQGLHVVISGIDEKGRRFGFDAMAAYRVKLRDRDARLFRLGSPGASSCNQDVLLIDDEPTPRISS